MPEIRTCARDSFVIRRGAPSQRIERKRRRHIGRIHRSLGITQTQRQQRQHPLRSIQKRQALFSFERERRNLCVPHRRFAGNSSSLKNCLALSNRHLRQMRKRSQIARRSHRPLARNHRMHFPIQHRAKRLRHNRTHARKSLGNCIRSQHEHRPRFMLREWCTHPARVAANQIHLQLPYLVARNSHRRHLSESGIHPVHCRIRFHEPFNHRTRCVHRFARRRRKFHLGAIENDGIKLRERQMFAVDLNLIHPLFLSWCFIVTVTSSGTQSGLSGRWASPLTRCGSPLVAAGTCDIFPACRFAGSNRLARLFMNDFVRKSNRPPLRSRHPSPNREQIIKTRRALIPAVRFRHHQKTIVLNFHLLVFESNLPAKLHASNFKPREIIPVVHHAHLIRLRIPDADSRIGEFLQDRTLIAAGSILVRVLAHCPVHFGSRFSRNDVTPSRKSAVARISAFSRVASSISARISASLKRRSSRFVRRILVGLAAISCAAISWARSRSFSAGTTSVINPIRSASAASMMRPVSSNSVARFSPIWRLKKTDTSAGMNPIRTSEYPSFASGATSVKSASVAIPQPPAIAAPFTVAITGFENS